MVISLTRFIGRRCLAPRLTHVLLAGAALAAPAAQAQEAFPPPTIGFSPEVVVPESSREYLGDVGVRAHTNFVLPVPNLAWPAWPAVGLGPAGGLTPAQLREAYRLPSSGGSHVIVIVDAFDYPTGKADSNIYAKKFGLPQETSADATAASNKVFQIVYQQDGRRPAPNADWNVEAALDIEVAHALAPDAKIVLVEANSASFSDLMSAVQKAASIPDVKEISMSWGGTEFPAETSYDAFFPPQDGHVYVAASGDSGAGTSYPGVSPNVVCVGGTSLATNAAGAFQSESAWSGSGGGFSAYEGRPACQDAIRGIVGSRRGVPDVSFAADPNMGGVSIYCSPYGGWGVVGGTSESAPAIAATINLASRFYSGGAAQLRKIYQGLGAPTYRDITRGSNGYRAVNGWDPVTGVGSPLGTGGI